MPNYEEPEQMSDKREHLTSNKFGAAHKRSGVRREGRHLHKTDHHGRGYPSELGSHSAFPDHEGAR